MTGNNLTGFCGFCFCKVQFPIIPLIYLDVVKFYYHKTLKFGSKM